MKINIISFVALIFSTINAPIFIKLVDMTARQYELDLDVQQYNSLAASVGSIDLRVWIAERLARDTGYNSDDPLSEGLDESILTITYEIEDQEQPSFQFPLGLEDGAEVQATIVKNRDFEVNTHKELQTIMFHTPDGKKCWIDVANMFVLPDAFSIQYCKKLFNELDLREASVVDYFRFGKTRFNTYHHYKPLLTAELLLFLQQNASDIDGKLRRLEYVSAHSRTDLPQASYAFMLLLSRKGYPIYSCRSAGKFFERDYERALRNLPEWEEMKDDIIDIVNLLGGYVPTQIVTRK